MRNLGRRTCQDQCVRALRDPDIQVTGLGARSWGRLATGVIGIGFGAYVVIGLHSATNVPAWVRWTAFGVCALFVVLGLMLLVEAAQGRRPLELRGNILTISSRHAPPTHSAGGGRRRRAVVPVGIGPQRLAGLTNGA